MSESPSGVIHDIGYRHYDGTRLGRGPVLRALFVAGLRSTYGLGRTAKSKVLPFILAGCMLLPALILEAVLIFGRSTLEDAGAAQQLGGVFDQQLWPYTSYVIVTQVAIAVYLASQAPQLFSRDLRFRTIPLYFSRPLTRLDYVVAKYLALVGGLLILMIAPLLVMFAGGLLAGLPFGQEAGGFGKGVVGAVILALTLAGIAGLISSLTVRRGFAVAIIITIGMVTFALANMIRGIGEFNQSDATVGVSGLLSPITLLDGVQGILFDASSGLTNVPGGFGWALAYLGTTALLIGGPFALLLLRYRKVTGA